MPEPQNMAPTVFDTSVLLPALRQDNPENHPLTATWMNHQVQPLISDETIQELRRVLNRDSLTPIKETQAELYVRTRINHFYRPYCRHLPLNPISSLSTHPQCLDTHDQKFIDLAYQGQAQYLVTTDQRLLEMNHLVPFNILTPEAFLDLFQTA